MLSFHCDIKSTATGALSATTTVETQILPLQRTDLEKKINCQLL